MNTNLNSWWQARSSRERRVVTLGAAFGLLVLAPILIYGEVAEWRTKAAADLASARAIHADVVRIARAGPPRRQEGDARGIVSSAAATYGLTIARLEPVGADGLVVVFGVSDSRTLYQWIDAVGATGLIVRRAAIVRADEGPLVTAEFEIGRRR